jgi:hypothetical protein
MNRTSHIIDADGNPEFIKEDENVLISITSDSTGQEDR